MILLTPVIDKNVVNVANYSMIEHILQYVIHYILEYCRSISQPKWHDCIYIMTISWTKSSLPLIAFFDSNRIVSSF